MKNKAAEKVKHIISDGFDFRVRGMVVNYILYKGWETLSRFSDEDIEKEVENEKCDLMTDEFLKALITTAVKITKECRMIDEFIPFIIMETYNNNVPVKEITLYKNDFESDWSWQKLLIDLDIYDEHTGYVALGAYIQATDSENM